MRLTNCLKNKRSQAVLEYTILFALFISALVASMLFLDINGSFSRYFSLVSQAIVGKGG